MRDLGPMRGMPALAFLTVPQAVPAEQIAELVRVRPNVRVSK